MNIAEFSALPDHVRATVLAEMGPDNVEALLHDWNFLGRDEQKHPAGDWQNWVYMAGRGAGKTRSGAEWARQRIKAGYGRGALIAPTAADARDVMVEGESGLLAICWEKDVDHRGQLMGRPVYEPSKRRVTWANGAMVTLYSADEPERLRGPQHDFGWCDELGAWRYGQMTWDMFLFGLRLGTDPRCMITTTPRTVPVLRSILKQSNTIVTRGSTFSNAANLASQFVEKIVEKFKGTRLGAQELEGLLLEDVAGSLWTWEDIEKACAYHRAGGSLPDLRRVVVAVDPSGTRGNSDDGDAIGIVAAGIDFDDRLWVLADATLKASPLEWGKAAARLADAVGADCVVAERNYGGAMVEATLKMAGINVKYKEVVATRGKVVRAEPVAALYEQGRVNHYGVFTDLEKQLAFFTSAGYLGDGSPDRADALVWAITELALRDGKYNFKEMEKAWS